MIFRNKGSSIKKTNFLSQEELIKVYGSNSYEFTQTNKDEIFVCSKFKELDLNNIKNLPIYIIQGRHDTICPPFTAYKLKNALPNSNLIMIDNAGHSAFETGIKKALITALDDLRNQV